MFFQGLFTSALPYVVLVAAYVLGLMPGAYKTLKKIIDRNSETEIVAENKGVTIDAESVCDFITEFHSLSANKLASYFDTLDAFLNFEVLPSYFIGYKFILNNRIETSAIIARPPPVLK